MTGGRPLQNSSTSHAKVGIMRFEYLATKCGVRVFEAVALIQHDDGVVGIDSQHCLAENG